MELDDRFGLVSQSQKTDLADGIDDITIRWGGNTEDIEEILNRLDRCLITDDSPARSGCPTTTVMTGITT
jgi:hypothetical protein